MRRILSLVLVLLFAGAHVPADRLPRSSPEAQGVAPDALLAFIDAADREVDTMNSFMLVRHGHVVAEAWWEPYGPEHAHVLYSLSKSFTSTAVGLAIAEGHFSLHDRVVDFFPDDAPAEPGDNLRSMRVHDLLRMSAGHTNEVALADVSNWTQAFLAHPVPHLPGTHFQYNTPATFMLSAIVQKTTGERVMDYLEPRLFRPLGIEGHSWGTNPQGITLGGYGLSVRTEDIAAFGQLYLQKGRWNGEQLIPEAWVEAATTLQTSNGSNPESDWNQGYGYQFWRSRHNTYRGDGAFGQYMMVFPDQDAVVAITSGVRDMQQVMNLVWEHLLPALANDAALPADPEARATLHRRIAGLKVAPAPGDAASPTAARVSGRTYVFPPNEHGLEALTLDADGPAPAVTFVTRTGEHRLPYGHGTWEKTRAAFANGIEASLRAPEMAKHLLGSTGAWTDASTFVLKTVLYETPFYTTITLRFDGDTVTFAGAHNVAFGAAGVTPTLVGTAR